MDNKDFQFENEFEHPVSNNAIDHFNTLQAFSNQSTGLLETTLADTLGLSMHNAVSNQQQSQMTTAASVTNACARLLQTQAKPSNFGPIEEAEPAIVVTAEDRLGRSPASETLTEEEPQTKKKFSLMGFLKRNKGGDDA
ncbi:hypothetical protein G5S52_00755 [Grimontia sp. S25]|uniref:Killing trait domain-containing protein n=1 Tax=Grimontia sedimenti TaxID=2711294 RepID=A0A6M1R1S7_9GAMM|nr:RebB family R body protein [Grimontia sedimenti]NGN96233.1 hypothetical protein [Grimontia sedimenti]